MVRDTYVIYGLRRAGTSEYRYVGQTTGTAQKRFWSHAYDAQPDKSHLAVHEWMRKHGPHNIAFDILESCPVDDLKYLNYAEVYWISSLRDFGHDLLNHTAGGDGVPGYSHRHSDATKLKISIALRGTIKSEETKRKMSESKIGKPRGPQSVAIIRQIAEKNRGQKRSDDFKADVSVRMAGNTHAKGSTRTDESKAKLSASKTGTLNPSYGRVPSGATIEKRRRTFHETQHLARGRVGSSCAYCLGDV